MKIIQCNLNNCKGAQDLLGQHVMEVGIDFCLISEPAFKPNTRNYFTSLDGKAGILWNPKRLTYVPRLRIAKENFVVVQVNEISLIYHVISLQMQKLKFFTNS